MKYIFVTGGVVSGLGKGICAASLGRLLKQCGLKVKNQKFDPYLNVDPGTMSPYQHGEVFVTDDGAETDLDLGHYERFVDEALDEKSSVSSGKIFWSVLNRERQGGYLGGTVQIIPHVTDEIKRRIYDMDDGETDVAISEIGGTVGDIESQPFLEAIRQVAAERGRENVLFIHVPLIVTIPGSGELKSKPTQHSVKELLSEGIQPDVLVVRTDEPITDDIRRKIALFCNVEPDCVIQNATASTLYEVPLLLEHEGLCRVVCRKLHLDCGEPDMTEWRALVDKIHGVHRHVRIALVGKYVGLHDAYLSVVESLFHAGTACDAQVTIQWVDSETLTAENVASVLGGCAGVLVPGGFGDRGIEGMILAAQYARENGVPYLGICLGMQIAVIEFARHAVGWADAHSAEFSSLTAHPVIALLPDQIGVTAKGGTMRLGKYPCVLGEGTKAYAAYGTREISERHRHRYEFNNLFREELERAGMTFSGTSPDGSLVEIAELSEQDWYVGCQFHPEFKSRPDRPHPLFTGFVAAAVDVGDVQLVLVGAGGDQGVGDEVVRAHERGGHQQQLGARERVRPRHFGEFDVVADQHADPDSVHSGLDDGCAAGGEPGAVQVAVQVGFPVRGEGFAGRRDQRRAVVHVRAAQFGEPVQDRHARRGGDPADFRGQRSVRGLGQRGDPLGDVVPGERHRPP